VHGVGFNEEEEDKDQVGRVLIMMMVRIQNKNP
jgi:hypothetical protein